MLFLLFFCAFLKDFRWFLPRINECIYEWKDACIWCCTYTSFWLPVYTLQGFLNFSFVVFIVPIYVALFALYDRVCCLFLFSYILHPGYLPRHIMLVFQMFRPCMSMHLLWLYVICLNAKKSLTLKDFFLYLFFI